ncbi:MAG: Holliday junction resolvase [Chloracidobacterium sp.]|nr:Holliday junction resolvase [Chloracidobacterium sp.]
MQIQSFAIFVTICLIVAIIIIFSLLIHRLRLKEAIDKLTYTVHINEIDFLKVLDDKVHERFENWRQTELEQQKGQISQLALKDAKVSLKQWKNEQEFLIRQDAISRSQSVIIGKAAEHLLPYMPIFSYNPKEVRFIGDPIDLLIFDGINDGNLQEIIFLEVKTGQARLTARQKDIRSAINDGRVRWAEMRVD